MTGTGDNPPISGKTVLVTGGAGFIGSEIVREVADSGSEIVHVEGSEGDIDRSRADVSRLESLGYEATVPLESGLKQLVGAQNAAPASEDP